MGELQAARELAEDTRARRLRILNDDHPDLRRHPDQPGRCRKAQPCPQHSSHRPSVTVSEYPQRGMSGGPVPGCGDHGAPLERLPARATLRRARVPAGLRPLSWTVALATARRRSTTKVARDRHAPGLAPPTRHVRTYLRILSSV